jgi:hypothetical protein
MTGFFVIGYAIVGIVALSLVARAERQHCVHSDIVLWGDGRHDDSAALNAWLRGADAIWADSGKPVGASITGRSFRLSAAVYVAGGTGRRLDDFRMLWPERGETVAGGTILTGTDPDGAPALSGVSIAGGDPGEGIPFEAPEPGSASRDAEASCGIS